MLFGMLGHHSGTSLKSCDDMTQIQHNPMARMVVNPALKIKNQRVCSSKNLQKLCSINIREHTNLFGLVINI
jgi:hypothetical protein